MKLLSLAFLLFAATQDKPKAGLSVTDAGEAIALGETHAAFKGEAVVSNGRLSLVVAKNGTSVELRTGTVTRAKLSLTGVEKLDRVALTDYGKGGATLEVGGKGGSAKLRLKKGDVTVEAQPGE